MLEIVVESELTESASVHAEFDVVFCLTSGAFFAGEPIQALLNLFIYASAWGGLLYFLFPGLIFWGIGVLHALMVISNKNVANKIADASDQQSPE